MEGGLPYKSRECESVVSTTFLSENVYNIIVNLRDIPECSNKNCLSTDLLFQWDEINIVLDNISEVDCILEKSYEWFLEKIKIVWGIINYAGPIFIKSSTEKKLKLYDLSSWIEDVHEIEDAVRDFGYLNENEHLLLLLKLTSRIERGLGNVYSTSGKDVPFLLRDLLDSDILHSKIGKIQMKFLQILLGSVRGFNFRNIAWHGFFSPGELHPNILATLLITIASLGQQILNMEYPRRSFIKAEYMKAHSDSLEVFYSDISFSDENFMTAVRNSRHIPKRFWNYWKYAYHLFVLCRPGDFLIFMTPLMESMLRSVFCFANNSPERILTAEDFVFYTIIDDILAQKLPNGEENRLEKLIGTKLFQMLLDLFVYQEGPRLRDNIGHAELVSSIIPEPVARYTLGISVTLLLTVDKVENEKHIAWTRGLMEVPSKYNPIYHPASLLKNSLLNAVESLSSWKDIPIPLNISINYSDQQYIEIEGLLKKSIGLYFTGLNDVFKFLTCALESLFPPTMFRPKYELELLTMLRSITRKMHEISLNIISGSQVKFELWNKREMKSRMRDNYKRFFNCLLVLQSGLAFLLSFILTTLKEVHKYDEEKVKNIQRTYKHCLQYVQNAVAMSDLKKNRWNELKESTVNMCNIVEDVLNATTKIPF